MILFEINAYAVAAGWSSIASEIFLLRLYDRLHLVRFLIYFSLFNDFWRQLPHHLITRLRNYWI